MYIPAVRALVVYVAVPLTKGDVLSVVPFERKVTEPDGALSPDGPLTEVPNVTDVPDVRIFTGTLSTTVAARGFSVPETAIVCTFPPELKALSAIVTFSFKRVGRLGLLAEGVKSTGIAQLPSMPRETLAAQAPMTPEASGKSVGKLREEKTKFAFPMF